MKEIIIHLYLFWGVWKDIKIKKLPLWYFILGCIFTLIFMEEKNNLDMKQLFISIIPGIIFIMLSIIQHGKIGYGDGMLITIVGTWIGRDIWKVCYISMILISIFSCFTLLVKKGTRETRIPYYPFFWIALLIYRI